MAPCREHFHYTFRHNPCLDFPVLIKDESGPLYLDFTADGTDDMAGGPEDLMKDQFADDLSVSGLVTGISELLLSPTHLHTSHEDSVEVSGDANADLGTSAGSRSKSFSSCQSDEDSLPSLDGSSCYSDWDAEDASLQTANLMLQRQVRMLTAELKSTRAELAKTQQSLEKCANNSRNSRKELYKSKAAGRKAAREARVVQSDLDFQRRRAEDAERRAEGVEIKLETEQVLRCSRVSIIQSTKATIKKQESQILDQDRQLKLKDCIIRKLRLGENGTEKFTDTLREKVEEQQAVALRMSAMLRDAEESSFDLLNFLDEQEECAAELDLKIALLGLDGRKYPLMHSESNMLV